MSHGVLLGLVPKVNLKISPPLETFLPALQKIGSTMKIFFHSFNFSTWTWCHHRVSIQYKICQIQATSSSKITNHHLSCGRSHSRVGWQTFPYKDFHIRPRIAPLSCHTFNVVPLDGPGEAWNSNSKTVYGKSMWPEVVFYLLSYR